MKLGLIWRRRRYEWHWCPACKASGHVAKDFYGGANRVSTTVFSAFYEESDMLTCHTCWGLGYIIFDAVEGRRM